jgi:5-methylcytosine-specific restriction enzyme A
MILTLQQYFKVPPWTISGRHPTISTLSQELNRLSAYTDAPDKLRYRNPNGVYMKLMNLQYLDPSRGGRGLKGGGALEALIWEEYGSNREKLNKVANAIRQSLDSGILDELLADAELDEDVEAQEGRVLMRMHRFRERDPGLRKRKKDAVLRGSGRLDCEACGFNFRDRYGDHAGDFIEVDHLVQLSDLPAHTKTKLEDLALLCSNCHRMVHRQRTCLTLAALKDLLTNVRTIPAQSR